VLFEILTPVYAINDSISVMGSKIFNALWEWACSLWRRSYFHKEKISKATI
jgi:hypothetical protein